jgi:hypothetical protein
MVFQKDEQKEIQREIAREIHLVDLLEL